jgi:hypothetical protein
MGPRPRRSVAMDDDDQIICPRCHRGSVRSDGWRRRRPCATITSVSPAALTTTSAHRTGWRSSAAMPLVFIRRMQKAGFTCDRTRAPTYPDARMPAGAEDRADRRLAADRRGGALARQPAPPGESLPGGRPLLAEPVDGLKDGRGPHGADGSDGCAGAGCGRTTSGAGIGARGRTTGSAAL